MKMNWFRELRPYLIWALIMVIAGFFLFIGGIFADAIFGKAAVIAAVVFFLIGMIPGGFLGYEIARHKVRQEHIKDLKDLKEDLDNIAKES